MQKDGLAPIGFADKDGWPAMGTFDILNMRINGYDFHVELMAGKESWTDAKVKTVFDTVEGPAARCTRTARSAAPGRRPRRTWSHKKSGMYLLGMLRRPAVQGRRPRRPRLLRVPRGRLRRRHGHARGADRRLHDGQEGRRTPDGAKELLKYLATAEAQNIYLEERPERRRRRTTDADTSSYNALQKKAAELVGGAKQITQFLDRDTRPDFASTVMIPALQKFIKTPSDIDGLLKSIEDQKKSIYAS